MEKRKNIIWMDELPNDGAPPILSTHLIDFICEINVLGTRFVVGAISDQIYCRVSDTNNSLFKQQIGVSVIDVVATAAAAVLSWKEIGTIGNYLPKKSQSKRHQSGCKQFGAPI